MAIGNQLLSTSEYEDVNSNAPGTGGGNKTKTTYGNGNSISYVYDKLDRLIKTVYNHSVTSVTLGNTTHALQYDQSGNPTTYGNGERLYTNLTWEHGRQLVSLTTGGKLPPLSTTTRGSAPGKFITMSITTILPKAERS